MAEGMEKAGEVRFRERCQMAMWLGSIIGIVLGLAMCALFGFLDVQCRNDPRGKFWNAEARACQSHEVNNG